MRRDWENGDSCVPCLRRSGYAQAGRPFDVLTYCTDAARQMLCGLTGQAFLNLSFE